MGLGPEVALHRFNERKGVNFNRDYDLRAKNPFIRGGKYLINVKIVFR